jgi:hypothetical protein
MCKFFSCVSNGHGTMFYFDVKQRLELKDNNPENYDYDSHSSICDYYKINEDRCNKYEYNPFTKKFKVDQLNNINDSVHIEKQLREMDFSEIFDTGLFEIDLRKIKSLDRIELPEKYLGIFLSSLKKLENFTFPESCEKIYLTNCKELNNVTFPKKCQYIDLFFVKQLENIVLPKKYKELYLNSINSSDYVLPKKHGTIFFKNKTICSNIYIKD